MINLFYTVIELLASTHNNSHVDGIDGSFIITGTLMLLFWLNYTYFFIMCFELMNVFAPIVIYLNKNVISKYGSKKGRVRWAMGISFSCPFLKFPYSKNYINAINILDFEINDLEVVLIQNIPGPTHCNFKQLDCSSFSIG